VSGTCSPSFVHPKPERGVCRFRTWVVFLSIAIGTSAGAHAQTTTPEEVTRQYLDAMRQREWSEIARLTHPDAIAELRSLLEPLFVSALPEADDFRQEFLGVRTPTEAQALSDATVFINFVRLMSGRVPALDDALRTAVIDPIGHVLRGDTAFVVFRSTTTVEGMPVSNLAVLSLRRAGDTWRGLLTGDFSSLATALRHALDKE
jgi:hypothetical protein